MTNIRHHRIVFAILRHEKSLYIVNLTTPEVKLALQTEFVSSRIPLKQNVTTENAHILFG